jgi:membrane protein DedA with SNARE-associated domain
MAFVEVILALFQNYTSVLALIAGLLVGDLVLLLGILSGAGKINFWTIIIFAFLGGLIHDTLFYVISNSKFAKRIKKRFKLDKKRNKVVEFIEKLGNRNYFIPVLIAKFIYGVRDVIILYVAHNEKDFKKYMITVASADLIWLSTVTGLGWLAGNGYTQITTIFKGFEKWIFLFAIGLVIYYLIVRSVLIYLMKRTRKMIKKHILN